MADAPSGIISECLCGGLAARRAASAAKPCLCALCASMAHCKARAHCVPKFALVLVAALVSFGAPGCDTGRAGEAARPDASLVPCGRALCGPGGTRFDWRGVTAFALADLIADGRRPEARAFVEWAADTGFNVVRVLAMNHGWMDLSPEEGRRALPPLFALAADHGLHVQVVALAGTRKEPYSTPTFLREQVKAVSQLCASAPNCLLEIANEPYHSSQARLDDPALMEQLQEEVAGAVPVTWGASRHDAPGRLAGGTFVVVHLARGGDRWDRVGRIRQLDALSRRTGKFVVDNEPIGAAEEPVRDRRDAQPQAFFAQGLLSRIFEVGSTFHCEDCLLAKVPAANQQECARAFVAGATLIPPDVRVTSYAAGAQDGPLPAANEDAPVTTFAGTAGPRGWVVSLGPSAGPPDLQSGWRLVEQLSPWPEVKVWSMER